MNISEILKQADNVTIQFGRYYITAAVDGFLVIDNSTQSYVCLVEGADDNTRASMVFPTLEQAYDKVKALNGKEVL
jgi:hypothetical protein